jgi:hypothetical protein
MQTCAVQVASMAMDVGFGSILLGLDASMGETGPDLSAQCPLGLGMWELTEQGVGAGNVGGPGPGLGPLKDLLEEGQCFAQHKQVL